MFLTRDELLESGPAVYFLFQAGELVYVGQTKTLLSRVGFHARSKQFDAYSYIECLPSELSHIEFVAIRKFRPRLNRT